MRPKFSYDRDAKTRMSGGAYFQTLASYTIGWKSTCLLTISTSVCLYEGGVRQESVMDVHLAYRGNVELPIQSLCEPGLGALFFKNQYRRPEISDCVFSIGVDYMVWQTVGSVRKCLGIYLRWGMNEQEKKDCLHNCGSSRTSWYCNFLEKWLNIGSFLRKGCRHLTRSGFASIHPISK